MDINKLISPLKVITYVGEQDLDIKEVQSDSRKVTPEALFVAVKGTVVDGHNYIASAVQQGAVAIVCETIPTGTTAGIAYIQVKDAADALGKLASAWYAYPSKHLKLVGVTGTNGKTTIASLLYEMFRKLGYKVGLLSTVCNYINGTAVPTSCTTPDALTIQALMAQMVEAGCTHAFMEVSSHAVDQKRISGLAFDGAIFTNLTRDHLDYHKTTENYLKAKKKFFDDLSPNAFALSNMDDKVGTVMLQNTKAKKLYYSLRSLADYKGKILEAHFEGTTLLVNNRELVVPFVGNFNAYNLLAVYGAAIALGEDADEVLVILSTLHPVAGRFETFHSTSGYTAIVDYAHTPDALTNVLRTIQEVLGGNGQIITVVGCGGNRDKGKRPIMAKEAVKWSDKVILTSDNPRFEEPEDILQDMLAGLSVADMDKTLHITDRLQAIKTATMLVKKGDVILVAGKGHEDYQDIKGVKHPFDDREIIKGIFKTEVSK